MPGIVAPDVEPVIAGVSTLYLTGEEGIRVTSFGSTTGAIVNVRWRLLKPDGTLQVSGDRHVPNSDRSIATSTHPLAEGWLSGIELFASGASPRIGNLFCVVELVRGLGSQGTPLQLLWSGYITDTTPIGWPAALARQSLEGSGVLRSITGTDPAANVEISETVPTNARWKLLAARFSLVTDGNAANREVALTFDDGTNVYARIPARVVQTATLTFGYTCLVGAALETVVQDTEKLIRLPAIELQGGHRWNTVTTNRQATDNYGAPQYLVEEKIED